MLWSKCQELKIEYNGQQFVIFRCSVFSLNVVEFVRNFI